MKIPFPIMLPGSTEFCSKCKKPANTMAVPCGVDFGVGGGHILQLQTKNGMESVQITRDLGLARTWEELACECEASWRRKYLDHKETCQREEEANSKALLEDLAAKSLERDLTPEAMADSINFFARHCTNSETLKGELVPLSSVKISVQPDHIGFIKP